MEVTKQEYRRELVREFMRLNPMLQDQDIAKHFQMQGVPKASIYRINKRIKDGQDVKTKHRGGKTKL